MTTHICEYLPTFDNITSVIDTGLTEERLHDETTNSNSKKSIWVSKTSFSARQNKTYKTKMIRIYRLYSKIRAKNLPNQNQSEFMSYPLQEICLLSKQTIPFNTSITDMIGKAIEFPPFLQLRNSINYLKTIDALDTWEDMTDLGLHLINIPLELKYSKAILYSFVLKCLNPVVVIVSILTVGDPFVVDLDTKKRLQLEKIKESLKSDSYSDHILLYKLYMVILFLFFDLIYEIESLLN